MKDLVSFDKEVGSGGAHAKGSIGIAGDQIQAQVAVSFPIAKVIDPATKALDSVLDKLKTAIPGSWDDALIEKFKGEYKDELVKLLAE